MLLTLINKALAAIKKGSLGFLFYGGYGLGIQAGLQHFKHPGGAHAAADAHGDAHAFGTSAFAFDQSVAG